MAEKSEEKHLHSDDQTVEKDLPVEERKADVDAVSAIKKKTRGQQKRGRYYGEYRGSYHQQWYHKRQDYWGPTGRWQQHGSHETIWRQYETDTGRKRWMHSQTGRGYRRTGEETRARGRKWKGRKEPGKAKTGSSGGTTQPISSENKPEDRFQEQLIQSSEDHLKTTAEKDSEKSEIGVPKQKYSNTKRTNQRRGYYRGEKRIIPSVQSDELVQQLMGGIYECMVCCDRVKNHQEVWSCPCCYHIFHLRCIARWAKSPAATTIEGQTDNGWRCPGCQNPSTVIPSLYKCFCGRVTNPGQLRSKSDMSVPHSCGEPCRKRLTTSSESPCQHKCPQLCHPGPCPPCPVMVIRKCPCGKSSSRVRCSLYNLLPSCGEICDKVLNCGLHNCRDICHEGQCPDCTLPIELICYCRKETKQVACGQLLQAVGGANRMNYCCDRICNKPLGCGNHTCELQCHQGECSSCPFLPSTVSYCPCGAIPISKLLPEGVVRTSCLDDIPTCDNVCSRPLPCFQYCEDSNHLCSSLCHIGACPPCTLTSVVVCKCGRTKERVPCAEVVKREGFVCMKKCGRKLNCGRHQCQTKCCVSDTHTCERICRRKHDCGKHTCSDICHPGRCGPCWNISYEELTCHCGGEVMLPPIPCGTAPPTCARPCARVHSCDHPVTHNCHSDETCPPCTFLTDKMCMGKHVLRNYIPCHLKDVTCGRPCGKPLPCGMHSCRKICHKGVCQKEGESCIQPCTSERKYCSHICGAPCHTESECPDLPCKAKVTLTCDCGRLKQQVLCLASGAGVTSQIFHKLHSGDLGAMMRELQSGQSIKIDSVTMKTAQDRKLECNEECAQWERNRKLAEAFELSDVDHSPNLVPNYSTYLQEQARENPSLIANIEEVLKSLVESLAIKGGTSSTHSFKPMKREQRQVIHELALYYNCTTTSYDSEPLRNVVVTATKSSFVPSQTLSQLVNSAKHKLMPLPINSSITHLKLVPMLPETHTKSVPDYFNDQDV